MYAVQGNSKKVLVAPAQFVAAPFSVYDAQNNINVKGKVRSIQRSEESAEEEIKTVFPKQEDAEHPPANTFAVVTPAIYPTDLIKPSPSPPKLRDIVTLTPSKPAPSPSIPPEVPLDQLEELPPPAKPLVRVRTALNLSDSVDVAEGNNGPILVHEEIDEQDQSPSKPDTAPPSASKIPPLNLPPAAINPIGFGKPAAVGVLPQKGALSQPLPALPEESKRDELPRKKPSELPIIGVKRKISNDVQKAKKKEQEKAKAGPTTFSLRSVVDERRPSIDAPLMQPIEKHSPAKDDLERIMERLERLKVTPTYKFVFGYSMRPRDEEDGEDAYFACERGLGVSDGVSGWSAYGINAAAFSQKLMEECESEIMQITGIQKADPLANRPSKIPKTASYVGLDFQSNTLYGAQNTSKDEDDASSGAESENSPSRYSAKQYEIPVNTMQVLSNAYDKVTDVGSSTATVVVINRNEIEAVNLGDSGFIHFSCKNKEYYINGVSLEQQHEFNVPYQLSRLPMAEYLKEMERDGRGKEVRQLKLMLESNKMCRDNPEEADQYSQEVHENDIFVLGTDGILTFLTRRLGVFDNLFSYEMRNVIRECMKGAGRVTSRLAKVLANDENTGRKSLTSWCPQRIRRVRWRWWRLRSRGR